jgi:hypothetical protein
MVVDGWLVSVSRPDRLWLWLLKTLELCAAASWDTLKQIYSAAGVGWDIGHIRISIRVIGLLLGRDGWGSIIGGGSMSLMFLIRLW